MNAKFLLIAIPLSLTVFSSAHALTTCGVVADERYAFLDCLKDKIQLVSQGDKYGISDTQGHVILPAVYDDIQGFTDKTIKAKQKGKWQLFSLTGNKLSTSTFDAIGELSDSIAVVKVRNQFGYINASA